MRRHGTPSELERIRKLAVRRFLDGYTASEIAEFLEVDASSVRRWVRKYHKGGMEALNAKLATGRPPFLSHAQERIVLRWLHDDPRIFGFPTELWTCARLAQLIVGEFKVGFNENYLAAWLRQRGITPQKPQRSPKERDNKLIADWRQRRWPQMAKNP